MTIWLKIDVCGNLQPVTAKARGRVAKVYAGHGEDLYITAKRDGIHGEGSLHYEGLAFDIRYPQKVERGVIVAELRAALGSRFDVVAEGDHVHIEYDPK